MTLFDALILGLVEGITEFLPISSTGHLILASHALGLEGQGVDSFIDAIQAGAILAILVLYPGRFRSLLDFKSRGFAGVSALLCLGLTTLPPVIAGLAFEKKIKGLLFHPGPVALAMAAGALLIFLIDRRKEGGGDLDRLSPLQALLIGLWQCLALWPGMSRAACTLMGGMACGLSRRAAVEYSFLAAVPLLFAAAAYEVLLHGERLAGLGPQLALGLAVSFGAALLAVAGFVRYVSRHRLSVFAWYRLAAAAVAWWWLA